MFMRNASRWLLSAALVLPLPAMAFGTNAQYDQCMLLSLRNSQGSAAASMIKSSCQALYQNGNMLLPREVRFHQCILQNMPGVRDNFSVQQIRQTCRSLNPM